MILTMLELKEIYKDYTNLSEKLALEVRKGNLIKVARGVYETDRHTDGKYLARYISGRSYLSFEYALRVYDLIPEGVYTFTSATFHKGKKKYRENAFGNFSYKDVPDAAYPWGYRLERCGEYSCQIATPEKALCDKLYVTPPVRSVRDIRYTLHESLRIEEDDFLSLSMDDILKFCPLYRSNNLTYLAKYIKKEVTP